MNYAGLNEPLGQRNVLAYWPPRSKQSQDSANKKVFFSNFIFNSFKFDAHQNFDIFKANFIYTLLKSFRQQKGSGKSCKHFTFVNYDAGVTLAQKLPLV